MREEERRELLALARAAIAAHLSGGRPPLPPESGGAGERRGVFVSLHQAGVLRGCIGRLDARDPLGLTVAEVAVSAATADPRFPPVSSRELEQLHIELSVLGPREPIFGPDDVEIGRHGLMVESGARRGVLLPQVATEWNWDAHRFVVETCRKAGLSADAWQNAARLWRFEAEVFGEL
jgi:AmmeMemoRadiSam system protein A